MYRLVNRSNRIRSVCASPGLFPHASRQLETRLVKQYRRECEMNLVGEQRNDERNVAGSAQCKLRRREESKPRDVRFPKVAKAHARVSLPS